MILFIYVIWLYVCGWSSDASKLLPSMTGSAFEFISAARALMHEWGLSIFLFQGKGAGLPYLTPPP